MQLAADREIFIKRIRSRNINLIKTVFIAFGMFELQVWGLETDHQEQWLIRIAIFCDKFTCSVSQNVIDIAKMLCGYAIDVYFWIEEIA